MDMKFVCPKCGYVGDWREFVRRITLVKEEVYGGDGRAVEIDYVDKDIGAVHLYPETKELWYDGEGETKGRIYLWCPKCQTDLEKNFEAIVDEKKIRIEYVCLEV